MFCLLPKKKIMNLCFWASEAHFIL